MKDASGNLVILCILVKVRADSPGAGSILKLITWRFRAYLSKGEQLPGQMVVNTIERFELSFNGEVKLKFLSEIIDRKASY